MVGNTYNGLASSPLVTKALVLRDVIVFASNLQVEHIIVESNNLQLLQACHGETEIRCISNLIQDISNL